MFSPNAVCANVQHTAGGGDCSRLCATGNLRAIDIKALCSSVIGQSQMGPRVESGSAGAQHLLFGGGENAGYRSCAVPRPIEEVGAVRGHLLEKYCLPSLRR